MSRVPLIRGWRQRVAEECRDAARQRSRSRSPRGAKLSLMGVSRGFVDAPQSKTASDLIRDFPMGIIPAHRVQRYAANAVSDGAHHPFLKRFGRLGAGGRANTTCPHN